MIRIRDLTYTYPAAEVPALSGINLEIPAGQICALIGPNLAGKSTLCFAISGFVPHFYHGTLSGSVQVHDREVTSTPLADLAGDIGLVFANPFNQITGARFTVREEVAFGLENLGVPRDEMPARIEGVLELAGLQGLADRSPYALSGGQQQRVALASVIVMQPRVLVLDEPTSQLDPAGTREVFAALSALARSQGTTVVLAEHKLEWVAVYADRVVLLDGGRIVNDGLPGAVLSDPALATFGLAPTRYTRAARRAVDRGLTPMRQPLPVTLQQAIPFFQPTQP